jgi:hypothetical protein
VNHLSRHILYALAIVASVSLICTTVVGLWSKDTAQATIIIAAIAAIASPLIMGLLNMWKQAVDSEASKQRAGNIVRELKTEVQEAAKGVKEEAVKVATNLAKDRGAA